jgi:ATP-dependent exoDNAse (exonuclease V) beta subunit
MVVRPEIAGRLQRAAYPAQPPGSLCVETERTFAVPDPEGLLTGSVDRLVTMIQNGRITSADIIDFKTDQLRDNDDAAWQARVEVYRPQMDAYRRAVAALTSLSPDRISGCLLFVSSGRVASLF